MTKPLNLGIYVDPDRIEYAKGLIDDCPFEIWEVVAGLHGLAVSTMEHADDEAADDFVLTAESTRQRANMYAATRDAVVAVWNR